MKKIPLTQGKFALIDDEDFQRIDSAKWRINNSGYPIRCVVINGKTKTIFMHRLIMNTPKGMITDHIDRNPLNNQKSNLRVCTKGQNQANRGKNKNNKTGYKGVCYFRGGSIKAEIAHEGKLRHLGVYPDLISAALAYDLKARELMGAFARLNFPDLFDESATIEYLALDKNGLGAIRRVLTYLSMTNRRLRKIESDKGNHRLVLELDYTNGIYAEIWHKCVKYNVDDIEREMNK